MKPLLPRWPTPLVGRLFALVVPMLAVSATGSARAEDAKVTFVDNALPLLRQRCGSCHNADKKTAGLDVTTYAGIMAGGGSGEVITPGDATRSYLYRVVTHEDEPTMPPDGPPIPEAERLVLAAWIDGGVLENTGSRAVKAKKVDVAMTAPADQRPDVVPMPAHLPMEPVLRTKSVDACASLATSPWAPLAVVPGQKQVFLYDTRSLELVGVLPFPEGRPHVVRFSRGGGLVIAGGGVGATSGRVAIWDVRNGRRIRTLGDELDVILAADVSPDQRLVVMGGPQRMIRIWSVETGEKLHDLKKHTDWVQAAAFSPDGALVATADRAGGVFIWEAVSGREFLSIPAHPAAVTAVAWRSDSNMLATACEDGQIRLFEPENGGQVKAWAAHGGGVSAVEFRRNGGLVSIGRDKLAKLWKADGAQERAFEPSTDLGLAAAYCHETDRVLAGDWAGEVRVWKADDGTRVGDLDLNPPAIADRVARSEKQLAEKKGLLAVADQALGAGVEKLAAATAAREAAAATKQAADATLAEKQQQAEAAVAMAAAAKTSHDEALAALGPLDAEVAATAEAVQKATEAQAAVGEDETAKQAAAAAVTAAEAKRQEATARRDAHKTEITKRAAAQAEADKQAAAAGTARDQAKGPAEAAAAKFTEADTTLAAAREAHAQLQSAVNAAQDDVAQAAAAHARWLGEVAFQADYQLLLAGVLERERSLAEAEGDMAQAEARQQEHDQTKQQIVARRQGFEKQIAEFRGKIAEGEKLVADLTSRLEKRGDELAATRGMIERTKQAIGALGESMKSLDKGLEAEKDDADLTASLTAVKAAVGAKQTQLEQHEEMLAAQMAEKAGWEKQISDTKAASEKHVAAIAEVEKLLPPVAAEIDTAGELVAAAGKVVDEKRAMVAARQSEVDAAVKELDVLQGVGG